MNKAVICCIFASTLFFQPVGIQIFQDKKLKSKPLHRFQLQLLLLLSSKSVTNSKINSTTQLTATENNFSDSDIQKCTECSNSYYKTTTQKVKKLLL